MTIFQKHPNDLFNFLVSIVNFQGVYMGILPFIYIYTCSYSIAPLGQAPPKVPAAFCDL